MGRNSEVGNVANHLDGKVGLMEKRNEGDGNGGRDGGGGGVGGVGGGAGGGKGGR